MLTAHSVNIIGIVVVVVVIRVFCTVAKRMRATNEEKMCHNVVKWIICTRTSYCDLLASSSSDGDENEGNALWPVLMIEKNMHTQGKTEKKLLPDFVDAITFFIELRCDFFFFSSSSHFFTVSFHSGGLLGMVWESANVVINWFAFDSQTC